MILAPSTTVNLQGLVTLGSVDANNTVWRINQDGITGLGDSAPTIEVQQKTRGAGGWAGDSFDSARYVTVAGTIRADSPTLLLAAIDLLKSAVDNDEFTMTITESARPRTLTVRRAGETITQKVTNQFATYSIMVVALDPRLFGSLMTASTGLPVTTGGRTIPFTLPSAINATVVSGQIAMTNSGTKNGTVTMRVDGPCHGPIITHRGSGAALIFSSSLVLAAGEWLDIDMDAHTVLANGQASRRGYVTSAGWSAFEPGANVWAFTAASYDSGALLTVRGTPAS
jgi:hypothetical protein